MNELERGSVWWSDLPASTSSAPAFPRPVLIIQARSFNRSGLRTVIAATITTNLKLADAPGNVWVSSDETGLLFDSVVNVSQLVTLDKRELRDPLGRVSDDTLEAVGRGLKLILELS